MNDLTVIEHKSVDFNGTELMAVKCDDGNIYAGVRWICNGLGLSDNQRRGQYVKLNEDIVLSRGVKKISLPTSGGIQETLCIELNFLPLWLAKINAGIIDDFEVQERVVEYQFKVKDVLATAFIKQTCLEDLIIMQAQSVKELKAKVQQVEANAIEAKEAAATANDQIQAVKEAIIQTDKDWRRWVNKQLQKIGFKTGDYQGVKHESYDLLEKRGHCNLERRLENLKNRMREVGSTRTQINNANYLDVIEAEPRLKEIYTSIVRELAVKHVA